MTNRAQIPLKDLISQILSQQKEAGYSSGTSENYKRIFRRLEKLANEMDVRFYSRELADRFVSDTAYYRSEGYCHSRYLLHCRCIQFIDSYIRDGVVDWSVPQRAIAKKLASPNLQLCLTRFRESLIEDGIKKNTIDGYFRLVFYFLRYLEDKGYMGLDQVKAGDVTFFMVLVCQEHYDPTSIGSHLPGLRRFVQLNSILMPFEDEIPIHSPKKVPITPAYTDEELKKVSRFLTSGNISSRNKAIALIAFDTGLRAVDICGLQLQDIDWNHDIISIVQEKTGKALTIPLFPELGNALMTYLLEERPPSDSPYVFLSWTAPFRPLRDHSGIYNILRSILAEAGIEPDGRISGTRMTRHSYASKMLREGVPLTVISQALGHSNPNSTTRYLSTDNNAMASCTLPLPKGGVL